MEKIIIGRDKYANLNQQISSLFNLTLIEIRKKYLDYPHCLIEYFEKGYTEKAVELCFDELEITITCMFNAGGQCNRLYLYADRIEIIEELISYMNATYDYNFMKSRWEISYYYLKVIDADSISNEVCCFFFIFA